MTIPTDKDARARLWVALGNQPGVGAWFSVWTLSRESQHRTAVEGKPGASTTDCCVPPAKGSPA